MDREIRLLDVVALTETPSDRGLIRGQVGTVVETLATDTFLVEFDDDEGKTYATMPLKNHQLLPLYFEPAIA